MRRETIHITSHDGYRLKVLVYRPDGPSEGPATGLLWLHGGGYLTGMAAMAGMRGCTMPLT